MGSRAVSPGGALLRTSRMFSIPKTLREPQSTNHLIGEHKSETSTRAYPQHQAITSPYSSREKGDWGLKRPFPLKTTLTTSTPLIRVKEIDSVESVTDFASAADHGVSLEKFREMRVAMSVPRDPERGGTQLWTSSVFEEDMDFTDVAGQDRNPSTNRRRWKFKGPWLARMPKGEFDKYLEKKVRPRRAQFRDLLRKKLAEQLTISANTAAMENGREPPPPIEPEKVSKEQFAEYVRSLRDNRIGLYDIISQFLDMAPLGLPYGQLIDAVVMKPRDLERPLVSPYEKTGPPPSHPSAGISYLRTNSYMDNHPVYGPQALRAPVEARVISPRSGPAGAKLGVGGFVTNTPVGDNEFNLKYGKQRTETGKDMLTGISYLDTTTLGGAKAHVEAKTANVDPSGNVVLQLRETKQDAKLISLEMKGRAEIYTDDPMQRPQVVNEPEEGMKEETESSRWRMGRVADAILDDFMPQDSRQSAPEEAQQEPQERDDSRDRRK
ncbi:hypothetical protein HIM_07565 [Hirsutella minnesotensis 3608]|uniref:Uncharacterized protein n=1 Tax=Hirsutella minnesotensis 3608 TaxID=1043627 RepID=A0A0F7ZTE9_9HYPO|nr:hypothetical protein HIM_07565 [Hirsutella minnesotensis 3608]